MKPEALAGAFAWHKQNRLDKANGKVNYFPAVAKEGEPGVMGQEAYDWFMGNDVEKRAPTYRNQVTVESLEIGMNYDPTATLHLISPTPLLMIIASDDIITPTELEKKAFERAKEPKKLVVVPGRHFDAYDGPKHDAFALPAYSGACRSTIPADAGPAFQLKSVHGSGASRSKIPAMPVQ
jgi:hypothetical protein